MRVVFCLPGMAVPTPTDLKPEVGASRSEIETPALVVDLDVMEANMEAYANFAAEHDVMLRSHVKTHKIPAIAHQQVDIGGGILCQKLSEAEVMAAAGIDDIYLSYMVVGEQKLTRLMRLVDSVDYFSTTVDGPGNLEPLQAVAAKHDTVVDVILEIDIGLERTGIPPGDAAVALAEQIASHPYTRFEGIMAYEGHIPYGSNPPSTEAELDRRCQATMDDVEAMVERIEETGPTVETVGVGSTATSRYSGKHPVVTEIHPGMYPFMDAHLIDVPGIEKSDCALHVLTTVISSPANDRIVVDAGSKSIALELETDPIFAGTAETEPSYYNGSEEHGWIKTAQYADFQVGDRLPFIPPHVCPTINLHNTVIGLRDDTVETVWAVQARGKVK